TTSAHVSVHGSTPAPRPIEPRAVRRQSNDSWPGTSSPASCAAVAPVSSATPDASDLVDRDVGGFDGAVPSAVGSHNAASSLRTALTRVDTGYTRSPSPGHGARRSPASGPEQSSQRAYAAGGTITGIRSCTSRSDSHAAVVRIVHVSSTSPSGDSQRS